MLQPPSQAPEVESAPPRSSVDVAQLFREHNAALLRFAAARLGSEQEAREVAQEAYVRLLQLDHPETISYLRAFLFKVAANLATDRLRARRRLPPQEPAANAEFATFELSPERHCAGVEMLATLNAAVAELPEKCRLAFLLHRVDGLSRPEVAARLHLGERMVRLYIARALEHLRRRLDEASDGDGTGP